MLDQIKVGRQPVESSTRVLTLLSAIPAHAKRIAPKIRAETTPSVRAF